MADECAMIAIWRWCYQLDVSAMCGSECCMRLLYTADHEADWDAAWRGAWQAEQAVDPVSGGQMIIMKALIIYIPDLTGHGINL